MTVGESVPARGATIDDARSAERRQNRVEKTATAGTRWHVENAFYVDSLSRERRSRTATNRSASRHIRSW
ncbi:hypothetical protein CP556_11525 [Natrinema sp. CBA1119]|nr:hypothetical protein CP556_11525 [Natrinema sp. CBA1119]